MWIMHIYVEYIYVCELYICAYIYIYTYKIQVLKF